MSKQQTEGKQWVSPVKTFPHSTLGTMEANKSYHVDDRIANRLLTAGLVNPSAEETYSTKVIQQTPVVGNANPSSDDGTAKTSSASQVAPVSTQKTANKSAAGAKPKKRAR